MSLCPYAYLRVSLSGFLTASDQGSLMMIGELLNISALDPLLPTFLIATLCLCALSVITYYSLALAWEVFWASRRSPSPLDPSAEVVLTGRPNTKGLYTQVQCGNKDNKNRRKAEEGGRVTEFNNSQEKCGIVPGTFQINLQNVPNVNISIKYQENISNVPHFYPPVAL